MFGPAAGTRTEASLEDDDDWVVQNMMETQRIVEESERGKKRKKAEEVKSVGIQSNMYMVQAQEKEDNYPENGVIRKVVDYNTMIFEFHGSLTIAPDKSLEDYKIVFFIKGMKGNFVNGRYKVGIRSFDGYPAKMLGINTLIVEVPEYDLIKNGAEMQECTIIFSEQ